jgi:hypothetical protein
MQVHLSWSSSKKINQACRRKSTNEQQSTLSSLTFILQEGTIHTKTSNTAIWSSKMASRLLSTIIVKSGKQEALWYFRTEQCLLRVSSDRKSITWEYQKSKRVRKSNCKRGLCWYLGLLKDVIAVGYGALSGTFYKYRNGIIQSLLECN